ncbi:MAG: STAS/SEC14 domain-containing protein [Sphingomonadales bacterium]
MYELLPDTRPGLISLRVTGKMSRADYETLEPLMKSQVARHQKPDMLIVMEDFKGFDGFGAVLDDLKLDVRYHDEVGKVAMVGDRTWQKIAVKIFSPFYGSEMRYYEQSELEDAKRWLAA